MKLRLVTWNVNSVRLRAEQAARFIAEQQPDVLCLQEIKCQDEGFPALEVSSLGYNIEVHGQKGFHGVALLSKHPIEDVRRGLPPIDGDTQSRFISGLISTRDGAVRVCSAYMPNGNPIGTEKFAYKLAWMERLHGHARDLLATEKPFVLAGDYNVCPTDDDVYDPVGFSVDALCQPQSRAAFRKIVNLGLTDAIHVLNPAPHQYTFWDYQMNAWPQDHGLRIDHLLLSPQAADRLVAAGIDKDPRAQPRASDHTPVWCELA